MDGLRLTADEKKGLAVWAAKKKAEIQKGHSDAVHKRELSKLRKSLQVLSDSILLYLHRLDILMKEPSTVERGQKIAKLCNLLDEANDHARYFSLGVDYRKDDKAKATAKLLAKRTN
jgi:hypothetical protein